MEPPPAGSTCGCSGSTAFRGEIVRVADTARLVPPALLAFAVAVMFEGGLTPLSMCCGSTPSWWRIDKTASVEIDAANTMGKTFADFFVFFFLGFIKRILARGPDDRIETGKLLEHS